MEEKKKNSDGFSVLESIKQFITIIMCKIQDLLIKMARDINKL